jgi:hypothetical protein
MIFKSHYAEVDFVFYKDEDGLSVAVLFEGEVVFDLIIEEDEVQNLGFESLCKAAGIDFAVVKSAVNGRKIEYGTVAHGRRRATATVGERKGFE